ncbi:MAG: MBL fold metallo-hydrolase [Actinomycetota bacterium]|nr:MBL fold metallo-hydrolase [Actinomycetota bacterium]
MDAELDWSVTWHAGHPSPKHDPAPEIQSHWVNDDVVVLRQNMSAHFEAPFMFLVFGRDRALLIDTGATPEPQYFPLRTVVDEHVARWMGEAGRADYELVVAHTHGHGDHRAADGQFLDRPHTSVVGHELPDVREFYGFDDWPSSARELDLGGRVVDVIPAPGHHPSATVFHDRATGLLLTGDSLLPGRIYVEQWSVFVESVDRLVQWADHHPVSHVVGCHIEVSADGLDYPRGTTHQPDEPPIQMPAESLHDLQRALAAVDGRKGEHRFEKFHVWNFSN